MPNMNVGQVNLPSIGGIGHFSNFGKLYLLISELPDMVTRYTDFGSTECRACAGGPVGFPFFR
jgi:hypothetical protein